ncbi:MAG: hypothetical protein FWE16_01140 [Firmicutes bacterium]|nr:hypothetical protein [Bacillota bacterium]
MKKEILYKTPRKIEKQSNADRSRLELVKNVIADFEDRKVKRRSLELQWRLNLDFYSGHQNNFITSFDTLSTANRQFFWQQHESFNHITPIIESRLAKITSQKGELSVLPQSASEVDKQNAQLCEKIIDSAMNRTDFDSLAEQAAMWSEVCGTVFYKVYWDATAGNVVGIINTDERQENVYDGDIKITVCSPFEIFPDNLRTSDIEQLSSIIHAKNVHVDTIKESWGVDLSGLGEENVTVIERYESPTKVRPNGRLIIIAGDKLLHDGDLPFINAKDATRGMPFVRQTSESFVGSFYGRSVIDRAIPVQRAYNAVKNRKVEFLNRLACGVLAVEDGSVDIDALENDGLAPGKIIVYRSGQDAPKFIDTGKMPAELEREEERLLREFDNH